MPQMAPMWWLFLMIILNLMMMMSMIKIYFTAKTKLVMKKNKKLNKINWW